MGPRSLYAVWFYVVLSVAEAALPSQCNIKVICCRSLVIETQHFVQFKHNIYAISQGFIM